VQTMVTDECDVEDQGEHVEEEGRDGTDDHMMRHDSRYRARRPKSRIVVSEDMAVFTFIAVDDDDVDSYKQEWRREISILVLFGENV
jgi:hypothetical protein